MQFDHEVEEELYAYLRCEDVPHDELLLKHKAMSVSRTDGIATKQVGWQVRGKHIVRDVSLQLHCGELLAIVGPNGAGKSTLLKLLTGDLKPSSGSVEIEKKQLNRWSLAELAKRRSVLLQQSRLSFGFSVEEVVLMGRMPHNRGVETEQDYTISAEALELVGLSAFSDRTYTTLSGGEQQRVQLARVLAQIWETPVDGGRYLLLDEPTNSLDLAYQQQVLRIAKQLAANGTGVLAILHDLNLAAQYADRIVMLKDGCIVAEGHPHEVLNAKTIEMVFATPVSVLSHPVTGLPLVTPN